MTNNHLSLLDNSKSLSFDTDKVILDASLMSVSSVNFDFHYLVDSDKSHDEFAQ